MTAPSSSTDGTTQPHGTGVLKRELGLFHAIMMGLGSIVGTGVFVSIGIAAGIAGTALIPAVVIAAVLALCNALSSAQLAAAYPVSGGTYEYGYRTLHPLLGFTAGWMFLCAKSASAATAALGFAGYLLHAVAFDAGNISRIILALVAVAVLTVIVLAGMQRTRVANAAIVSVTLTALALFVLAGWLRGGEIRTDDSRDHLFATGDQGWESLTNLLHASALMFVAYTGYGRIATLGEEVHEPKKTIPRAIVITLGVSAVLYLAVGLTAIGAVGHEALYEATRREAAPLEMVAAGFGIPGLRWVIAFGAVTAMLGVLLNLILGLSRVVLAMGRRGDMPRSTARLVGEGRTPPVAVIVVGLVIGGLVLLGNVETTWSFSAFTVLIYYGLTNLAALRLPRADRLYPRIWAWLGLIGCTVLAFRVDRAFWMTGLGMILAGWGIMGVMRRFGRPG